MSREGTPISEDLHLLRQARHELFMGNVSEYLRLTNEKVPEAQHPHWLRLYNRITEHLSKSYWPPTATYRCSKCPASGVKLWRGIGWGSELWCAKCGMEQAGLPDTIGDDGRNDEGDFGPSDQIYSPRKGQNLLPCIPDLDGSIWGYTSVPPEGVAWWRARPTRKTP